MMSTILTTQKKITIVHHGKRKSGKPINAIGYSIHSSAVIRPSSLIPSVFSALSQIGIAASVKIKHAGICAHAGKPAIQYANTTPGKLPNVPGANGATSPNPNPEATNKFNFSNLKTLNLTNPV